MIWLLLFISILNLLVGIVVYVRNPRSFQNSFFAILSFASAIWVFNNFMTGVSDNPEVWLRGAYAWGSVVIGSGLVWILYLTRTKNIKWKALVIYILTILFFVTSYIGNLIIDSVEKVYVGRFEGTTGPLFVYFSVFSTVVVLSLVFRLIYSYIKSTGIKKTQLLIVLIGAFAFSVTSTLVSFVLPSFGYFKLMSFDSPSSLFFIGSIAYAITRYRFLDIRLIIARTIAFGSIVVILSSVFAILSAIIAKFFAELVGFRSDIIAGVIISILVAAGYKPIVRIVEKVTDKFLFKKSYNPDELLAKISDASAAILDLQELLKTLSKLLNDALQFEKIGFAFITSKGDLEISYEQGFKPGVAEGLIKYPDIVSILVKQLEETPGLLAIDEMQTRFENGEFKPVSPELLKTLHENNIAVIIPLYSKDDLIGLVSLGVKKSGGQYTTQDLTTLDIFAGQAAVAIENARLYDELRYFNIKLAEEVKQKTAELRKANVQLKRLDQAKSDFISIASHQLRTPLTIIKGYISMMQEGSFGKVPKIIDQNLSKVYLSNERLIALVENLLDISRIESGRQQFEWTKVNLVDLASRLTGNLVNNAKDKGLKLIFHTPKEKIPIAIVEFNRLQDVMINFIDNAIKYTEKGKIEVTLEAQPEGMITFCIKDTGRGIDPEVKSSLFKKFSRGKGSFQVDTGGSGLGLYVAKMVIEAHEGKIWAESKGRDKGATFCFSIPIEGPKNRKDLPFAKPGQKVVDPVKSSVREVPKLPGKPEKKK